MQIYHTAYDLGINAFKDNIDISENPFDPRYKDYLQWEHGWRDQKESVEKINKVNKNKEPIFPIHCRVLILEKEGDHTIKCVGFVTAIIIRSDGDYREITYAPGLTRIYNVDKLNDNFVISNENFLY